MTGIPSAATSPKRPKFLIIRFSSFGDVMQSLSIPSAILRRFPTAEIHWITRKDMAPLLRHHPAIHRIWEFDRKQGLKGLWSLLSTMKSVGFTHIYDAHNNLRSRLVSARLAGWGPSFLSGVHFIRRSQKRWKRFLLFRFRKNTYELPFSGQRDLLEPLVRWGIEKLLPPVPQFFVGEEDLAAAAKLLGAFAAKPYVALAPSAAYFLKRWPIGHFQQLIRELPETRFVLLGGPEDTFIEEIAAVAPDRTLNLAGKSSLPVSGALVMRASVLVSNDTGLLHVGEQSGVPTIALMGPAPFGFPSRPDTKILELDLACRPCSKHGQGPCINPDFHKCLKDIRPDTVAFEVRKKQSLPS
jgi:ADP-heptose:LPS heptosyltransferase